VIPLSGRYLAPLVALLALALIPVAIRHAGGNHGDACRSPAALYEVSEIPRTEFGRQHPDPTWNVPSAVQWTQGRVLPSFAGGSPMKFDLIRAESALDLYAWSRKTLSPDYYVEAAELVPVEAAGESLPVLVQRNHEGAFGAMLFVEANRPTAAPIAASLRRAARELRGPVQPASVFFVRTPNPLGSHEVKEEDAIRWLRDAWLLYRATCSS